VLRRLDEAEAAMREALRIASAKEALGFELSAAMSLVQLERLRGNGGEAKALHSSVYTRFSEGFDTRDLLEAKSLLVG
jgi:predicted ATPase